MEEDQKFCTFWLDGLFCGIDVAEVQEVIRAQEMTPVPSSADVVRGLINLRGQIVTAIDLRRRMGLEPLAEDQASMNVVIRTSESVVSFLVDRIGDVIEIDPSDREAPPQTISARAREVVRGVCKLEGRLLLILDTEALLNLESAVAG